MTKREDANLDLKTKGLLFVISAPSGGGKDTVIKELFETDLPINKTISATTRAIRDEETDGVDYYFIDKEEFERRIQANEFLEYTLYNGNYYGTLKQEVERCISCGGYTILKIEVEGAGNVRNLLPEAKTVFIVPPSMEVLEQRLRSRGTEDEADIKKRLEIAQSEIGHSKVYDYLVVNDDSEKTSENVLDILHKLYK
jgi:guanylate kinase